jgi:hypothetical protein
MAPDARPQLEAYLLPEVPVEAITYAAPSPSRAELRLE